MTTRRVQVTHDEDKIIVTGNIELARELELGTSSNPFDQSSARPMPRNSWVRQSYAQGPAPGSRGAERVEVTPRLHGTGRSISLSNDGLVLQYGVFGEPGSGKTNLLMHLLHQVMALHRDDSRRKYGGFILDPKAALIDGCREIFRGLGREDDLIVVNSDELQHTAGVNVIRCALTPGELGEAIMLGARAAGFETSESFWSQEMSQVFGAIATLHQFLHPSNALTLDLLMYYAVGTQPATNEPNIDFLIRGAASKLETERAKMVLPGVSEHVKGTVNDVEIELLLLQRYASNKIQASDPKQRSTVEKFMQQALQIFRKWENRCFSDDRGASLYDPIIEDGKVVLVSVNAAKMKLAPVLISIMKVIFQQTVLSRFNRYRSGQLVNRVRPLLFMADEYHTVATHLSGSSFSDGNFFSLARQFGAMSIVATQTVAQLEGSVLGKNWNTVFDPLQVLIFMRGKDPGTREYLDSLAGKREHWEARRTVSFNDGKQSISTTSERTERPVIPKGLLEQLERGDAVFVGSTAGGSAPISVRYGHIPEWHSVPIG